MTAPKNCKKNVIKWTNQGAKNLIKAFFPAIVESKLALFKEVTEALATAKTKRSAKTAFIALFGVTSQLEKICLVNEAVFG